MYIKKNLPTRLVTVEEYDHNPPEKSPIEERNTLDKYKLSINGHHWRRPSPNLGFQ